MSSERELELGVTVAPVDSKKLELCLPSCEQCGSSLLVPPETRCEQDEPFPTVLPTSYHPSPSPPHPSPSPIPESPSVYKYNVSGANGTCLLASMGLQLNITYKKKDGTVSLRSFKKRFFFVQWSAGAQVSEFSICVLPFRM